MLFPAGELKILPYNRTVRDLNGRDAADFLREAAGAFTVKEDAAPTPARPGQIAMYLDRRWYGLTWEPDAAGRPCLATGRLRAAGAGCSRRSSASTTRARANASISSAASAGRGELEERVDSGRDAVAFSMYPTTVEQLMAIADAGQIMPPKSTWFEPKLRSGLFIHTLD